MVTCRPSGVRYLGCLLRVALLLLALATPPSWAGIETITGATVSVSELERVAHQIEGLQQREQLLKTLHTLDIWIPSGRWCT
jgi:hypothetical protein